MSNFKKLKALFAIVLLLLTTGFPYAATVPNVVDNLNLLTADDIQTLQTTIARVQTEFTLDIAIVLTDQLSGKTSMAFADDYYDENGFGLDSQYSGLALLINMADREVWISTTGKAIDIFTDTRITTMVNHITDQLSVGNFAGGCRIFLDDVSYYANAGVPANQVRVEQDAVYVTKETTYLEGVLILASNPLIYLVALVIAGAVTLGVTALNKGRQTTTYQTYELPGSFHLSREEDTYLREYLSRTKVEKNNNSSSSSFHSGSSGRSHGGGGGKF